MNCALLSYHTHQIRQWQEYRCNDKAYHHSDQAHQDRLYQRDSGCNLLHKLLFIKICHRLEYLTEITCLLTDDDDLYQDRLEED